MKNGGPAALVGVTALAALGYLGVYRLGMWLDGPLVPDPGHTAPVAMVDWSDDSSPATSRASEQDSQA